MAVPVIVAIIALASGSAFGLIAIAANFEMLDKVNEKLSKEEQLTALSWRWSKTQGFGREYERLYPSGRLRLRVRSFTLLAIGCLLISAWGFGFFSAWTRFR
jgi:hypothetical protein